MAAKPGTIYEVARGSFDRTKPLDFAAVNIYLGRGKSVDVWVEDKVIVLTCRDEYAEPRLRGSHARQQMTRDYRLAIRPGGSDGADIEIEVLP